MKLFKQRCQSFIVAKVCSGRVTFRLLLQRFLLREKNLGSRVNHAAIDASKAVGFRRAWMHPTFDARDGFLAETLA